MKGWRIPQIVYDQFGGGDYQRVYGWGWLAPLGVLVVVIAALGLVFHWGPEEEILAMLCMAGFVSAFAGLLLNGYSEKRALDPVFGRCLDVEWRDLGHLPRRGRTWGVRALVEYQYQEEVLQATPMPQGRALFGSESAAQAFAAHLQGQSLLKLYVDPKRPKRVLFDRLYPPFV